MCIILMLHRIESSPPKQCNLTTNFTGIMLIKMTVTKQKKTNASTISCHVTRASVAKHKKKHERQPAMKSLRNTILQEIVTEIENKSMKAEKKCKHGIKTRIIEKHQVSQPWITRVIIDHCRCKNKNSVVDLVDGKRNEVGDGIEDE